MSPTAVPRPRNANPGANATADRAIEILLLFSNDHPVWTSQELAAHLQMPRSTVYRYLGSLRANGLIVQDAQGRLSLGPRLLHLSQIARVGNPVLAIASEHMQRLSEQFREIVVLNERIGSEIIALERIDSPERIGLKSSRTHLLPWPATGSAKVLLAFARPEEQQELIDALTPTRYTEHTLDTLQQLQQHLLNMREQGFAASDEERDKDVWGASVPLFHAGECRHALSVVGPKFRIPSARRTAIIRALIEAGQAISTQLGAGLQPGIRSAPEPQRLATHAKPGR